MPLYAVAVFVPNNTTLIHKLCPWDVVSSDEAAAIGWAYANAVERFPASEGYSSPSIVVQQVRDDLVIKALPDRIESEYEFARDKPSSRMRDRLAWMARLRRKRKGE